MNTYRKMRTFLHIIIYSMCFTSIISPPVQPDTEKKVEEDQFGLEYERYLKEVVNILENDETFKQKLDQMNSTDIETGAVAKHLALVSKGVRTKLDELKRQEVERLRAIIKMHKKNMSKVDKQRVIDRLEILFGHIDHNNPETFEEKDLQKLIKKATHDLTDIDQKRKAEFKEYELEKEVLRRKELEKLNKEEREKREKEFKVSEEKHKDHPKVHHPGSKEQLEEVWEKDDGLEKDSFDAKSFFKKHDINSDDVLDELEVESLFQNELDKVYDPNNVEDDMNERYEEMSRMREHLMNQMDRDEDRVITLDEFLNQTQTKDYKEDQGWDTIDDDKEFNEEEIKEYMKELEEKRKLKFEGHVQPGEINVPVLSTTSTLSPISDDKVKV